MKMFHIFIINFCIFALGCANKQTHIEGKPYHHLEEGYRNLPGGIKSGGFSFDHIVFGLTRPITPLFNPEIDNNHIMEKEEAIKSFYAHPEKDSITWIGHMTAILRIDGQIIAIDPWFSNWAAAAPPFGAKRVVPPGLSLEDLPQINIIVISHNHYDHLDMETLKQIPNPGKITVIVPPGVGRYIKNIPFAKIIELDWDESAAVNNVEYRALPVVHYSRRTLFDGNKSLWAAFSIKGVTGKKIYFSEGEYGEIYKETGAKYGPFDVALIASGAYEPRKVMQGNHSTPENSVQIGLDIKARNLIPVHWGTTQLSTEPFMEPGKRFKKAALEKGIPEENIWIMKIGETRYF